ncbi:MAG: hypothetical protein ABI112_01740 [Terracoccus sp.]
MQQRLGTTQRTGGLVRRGWLLASVAAALGFTVAGCSSPEHVPLPSALASPQDVVRAYSAAVHAGDCETAGALVTASHQSWCGSVDITALKVTRTTQEPKATATGSDGPLIERVWVDLTSQGGDVSFPDGDHEWSYLLDRTGPQGPWRIYDQGMG